MAVRNQHVRQSKGYVSVIIGNRSVCFFPKDSFVTSMAQVRYRAKKTAKNNVKIDDNVDYINVNVDGTLEIVNR